MVHKNHSYEFVTLKLAHPLEFEDFICIMSNFDTLSFKDFELYIAKLLCVTSIFHTSVQKSK